MVSRERIEYLNCRPGILGTGNEDQPDLADRTDPGTLYQPIVTQLSWMFTISREGGLFDLTGRRVG